MIDMRIILFNLWVIVVQYNPFSSRPVWLLLPERETIWPQFTLEEVTQVSLFVL